MARVSVPEFLGRRAELAALRAAASARDVRLVLIDGDAGVGKTRLVNAFTARIGATVLSGGCLQLEADIPFAPFVEALPHVFTGMADGDRAAEYRRFADAVRAAGERVVLVVEDVHWADAATRDLLLYLHRALANTAVLMVVTSRTDEVPAHHPVATLLAELARSRHTQRLSLAPLDRDGVAALATAVLGTRPPADLVDTLVARAEGNPFYTEELLAAGDTVPSTVREIIVTRLARLPEPAQRLARLASVVGRTVPHDLLAALAPDEDLDRTVRSLIDHGHLVIVEPDSYAFRHALIHEALYRELLPGERRQAHAAVARCLAERPELAMSPAAELAHHWDAAGEAAPALAAAVRAAAVATEGLAPAAAHAHYERALRRWPDVPDPAAVAGLGHDTLLEQAAEAASLAGHNQRAVELTQQRLAELRDPERVANAYEQLSYQARSVGNWELARHAAAEAVRLLPVGSAARPTLESWRMMLDMLGARHLDAVRHATRLLPGAEGVARNRALTVLGAGNVMLGHVDEGVTYLEQHRAFAWQSRVPRFIGVGYVNASEGLIWADRHEQALAIAREGRTRAGELGFDIYLLPLVGNVVRALTELGRWDEALDTTSDPDDPAADPFNWIFVDLPRAEILVRRGELTEAAELLKRIGTVLDGQGDAQYGSELAHLRARLAAAEGRSADARVAVREGLDLALPAQDMWLVARLVATGVALTDDPAEADELVAAGRAHRESLTGAIPLPRTLRAVALAEAERSRDPAAWAAVDGGPDRYLSAYARFREAEALLSAKRSRAHAAELLGFAAATAQELGAAPLAALVSSVSERARLKPAGTPSVLGLTAREAEILALVGQGRTNAEIAAELFISTKTASVHVSNILRKLGVKSRIQAAALAHRQEHR
ncbi:helix-turn-helix transcriptional regulator [Actinophytocola sp.]|uniref:helix-turn-helix transcriptional regulator n=1 Tax=Actinophytocola sp. TaxID=1872138 RepID=UPI002ED06EF6